MHCVQSFRSVRRPARSHRRGREHRVQPGRAPRSHRRAATRRSGSGGSGPAVTIRWDRRFAQTARCTASRLTAPARRSRPAASTTSSSGTSRRHVEQATIRDASGAITSVALQPARQPARRRRLRRNSPAPEHARLTGTRRCTSLPADWCAASRSAPTGACSPPAAASRSCCWTWPPADKLGQPLSDRARASSTRSRSAPTAGRWRPAAATGQIVLCDPATRTLSLGLRLSDAHRQQPRLQPRRRDAGGGRRQRDGPVGSRPAGKPAGASAGPSRRRSTASPSARTAGCSRRPARTARSRCGAIPLQSRWASRSPSFPKAATQVAVSPDGSVIASGGHNGPDLPDRSPHRQSAAGARHPRRRSGRPARLRSQRDERSPRGYGDGDDRAVGRRQRQAAERTLRGNTRSVLSLAFDHTGTRLVSGGTDGTVRLWNVRTGARGRSGRCEVASARCTRWRSVPTAARSLRAATAERSGCGTLEPRSRSARRSLRRMRSSASPSPRWAAARLRRRRRHDPSVADRTALLRRIAHPDGTHRLRPQRRVQP